MGSISCSCLISFSWRIFSRAWGIFGPLMLTSSHCHDWTQPHQLVWKATCFSLLLFNQRALALKFLYLSAIFTRRWWDSVFLNWQHTDTRRQRCTRIHTWREDAGDIFSLIFGNVRGSQKSGHTSDRADHALRPHHLNHVLTLLLQQHSSLSERRGGIWASILRLR